LARTSTRAWWRSASRYADIVGADRVIAGSDCGFGTCAGFGAVDCDIVYAKLAALAQNAHIASALQQR